MMGLFTAFCSGYVTFGTSKYKTLEKTLEFGILTATRLTK
jgi:hypothetical protein